MGDLEGFGDATSHALGVQTDTSNDAPNESITMALLYAKLEEIHIAVMEESRAASATRTEQATMKKIILSAITKIEAVQDDINSMRALMTVSGDINVDTHPSAVYTRAVSTTIPAAMIRGLWYERNPTVPLPVPFQYLIALCDSVMGEFKGNTKRLIGAALSSYVETLNDNNMVHKPMLLLMCQNNDTNMAEFRRILLDALKILGTHLAFMLPFELSKLLNRITTINAGEFVLNKSEVEKSMLKPHDGYSRIAKEHMEAGKNMKAIKKLRDAKFSRTSCTVLYNAICTGAVESDGKIIPSTAKEGKPVASFLSTPTRVTSVSSADKSISREDRMRRSKTSPISPDDIMKPIIR